MSHVQRYITRCDAHALHALSSSLEAWKANVVVPDSRRSLCPRVTQQLANRSANQDDFGSPQRSFCRLTTGHNLFLLLPLLVVPHTMLKFPALPCCSFAAAELGTLGCCDTDLPLGHLFLNSSLSQPSLPRFHVFSFLIVLNSCFAQVVLQAVQLVLRPFWLPCQLLTRHCLPRSQE